MTRLGDVIRPADDASAQWLAARSGERRERRRGGRHRNQKPEARSQNHPTTEQRTRPLDRAPSGAQSRRREDAGLKARGPNRPAHARDADDEARATLRRLREDRRRQNSDDRGRRHEPRARFVTLDEGWIVHRARLGIAHMRPHKARECEVEARIAFVREWEVGWRIAECRRREQHFARERIVDAVPQSMLGALGRLVILTDTDLACSLNIAVAWPGDHSGLVFAYLDTEMYNHFGWQWAPPKDDGSEPGGAVDLAEFGAQLEVTRGAQALLFRGRRTRPDSHWPDWTGQHVLHIRFKSALISAGAVKPTAEEIASAIGPAKPETEGTA